MVNQLVRVNVLEHVRGRWEDKLLGDGGRLGGDCVRDGLVDRLGVGVHQRVLGSRRVGLGLEGGVHMGTILGFVVLD